MSAVLDGGLDIASLQARLESWRTRVDGVLLEHLPPSTAGGTQLQSAMRYAVTIGGKRVRPVLTYATAEALGAAPSSADIPAAALEMMHAYSLVHDDLPAMDDDALRRGHPTCHIRFGEAIAILAGDALQALAFTLLATNPDPRLGDAERVAMVRTLGEASGGDGMAVGQAIDLEAVGTTLDLAGLERMHRHKTGALIRASVALGASAASCTETALLARLDRYAGALGLTFQIVDDILDVVSDTETLGKQQGADIARNKPTYPALLGLDGARQHAADTHASALEALDGLDASFDTLRGIAHWVLQRSF